MSKVWNSREMHAKPYTVPAKFLTSNLCFSQNILFFQRQKSIWNAQDQHLFYISIWKIPIGKISALEYFDGVDNRGGF